MQEEGTKNRNPASDGLWSNFFTGGRGTPPPPGGPPERCTARGRPPVPTLGTGQLPPQGRHSLSWTGSLHQDWVQAMSALKSISEGLRFYELWTKLLVWGKCHHQMWGAPYRLSGFWMFRASTSKQKHAIYSVGWFDLLQCYMIENCRRASQDARVPFDSKCK